jgi:NTP pyrophosphatase (non-canonical NTP hydrolase)
MNFTDNKLQEIKRLVFAVTEESKHQLVKWGVQSHTLDKWNTILNEETGELAKAINDYSVINTEHNKLELKQVYDEAIQVATLSLKIAEMVLVKMLEKRYNENTRQDS